MKINDVLKWEATPLTRIRVKAPEGTKVGDLVEYHTRGIKLVALTDEYGGMVMVQPLNCIIDLTYLPEREKILSELITEYDLYGISCVNQGVILSTPSAGSNGQGVPYFELKRLVAFFGDSTNARIGGQALNIAKGQDYTVINNAQGGSLAAYALMSMNGSPITVTFDVAEIPAKGANVNVPATLTYGEGVTPFSMHSTVVIIDDRIEAAITGQTTSIKVIPRDSNTHAVVAGKAYAVKLKANGSTDGICVIATSKNDINGANIGNWQAVLERCKAYVQKCIAQVEPQNNKRFIVLTNWADQNYNYETHAFRKELKDGYNSWLKTTYGNKVFDVESYILGSQVWADLGIQADEISLASQAAGKLPVALSSDGGSHLSVALEAKVAEKIIEKAKTLGYL